MAKEPDMEKWVDDLLSRFDFSGLLENKIEAPPQEESKEPRIVANMEDRVFLQKIVTEIWIYTDVENKTYGSQSTQDIVVLGEMSRQDAMQMIETKKKKRPKKTD